MEKKKSFQIELNISEEVFASLKTVLLLDKPYSSGYVIRLMRGDETFALRNDEHKEIETFGELAGKSDHHLEDVIHYLVSQELLEIVESKFGLLAITPAGEAFLDSRKGSIVTRQELRRSWYEVQLSRSLKQVRSKMAADLELKPYEIFTNYTLDQIVARMPETEGELTDIPAMDDVPHGCQIAIIAEVAALAKKIALDEQYGYYTKAASPSHRRVKFMFEKGMEINEIAEQREIKPQTVKQYLMTLHRAGEIDLKPWIESQVERKVLHKAGKFFDQVEQPKLKEAHEVLGYDYETLKLCQLYVTEVLEPEASYA